MTRARLMSARRNVASFSSRRLLCLDGQGRAIRVDPSHRRCRPSHGDGDLREGSSLQHTRFRRRTGFWWWNMQIRGKSESWLAE
jgi:hypothetical protein